MLLAAHTAIGVLIAHSIGNPYLGSVAALISHYLVDVIPHEPKGEIFYIPPEKRHRDQEMNRKLRRRSLISLFDLALSFIIFLIMAVNSNLYGIITGGIIIFFSLLPDILTVAAVYIPGKLLGVHHKYHFKLHEIFKCDMNYITAYGYQILLTAIILIYLYKDKL